MNHGLAYDDTSEHRVTLTCECGKEVWHPNAEGAARLLATHLDIETARTALKGDRT